MVFVKEMLTRTASMHTCRTKPVPMIENKQHGAQRSRIGTTQYGYKEIRLAGFQAEF